MINVINVVRYQQTLSIKIKSIAHGIVRRRKVKMIGLDTIMTLGYTFTAKTFITDIKLMVGGIGLSIFAALTIRI